MTRDRRKTSRRKAVASREEPWQSVRAEKVARAKELLREKGYPSRRILESVGELMAKGLKAPK